MVSKRTIPFGGKSGILPKQRPVFKRFPIRPPTEAEIAEEAKHEQGYKGVPVPKRRGFKFEESPSSKPVLTVEERIKRFIDDRAPTNVDESKLSQDELWALKRDEIRRQHLKDAYVKEAERLQKLDSRKERLAKEKAAKAQENQHVEDSSSVNVNLPTISQYLKGPLMRQRTPEEKEILQSQRTLNRNVDELAVKEAKATSLLDLYHAAGNFITTEEELAKAIEEKFFVEIDHENRVSNIKTALKKAKSTGKGSMDVNHQLVTDAAMGTINGQPGLDEIKLALSGEGEQLKRTAQLKNNETKAL
ncbi:hypothetical protein DIURU_003330 [Diutina rugosa]|uniref:Uncharacterized protein n=1 Tax=Diutina rugosa TaxID=5481 RepID=A0A642UKN4_DIURU|nr:uncharacterized protein DIURU_003330 [Diutina rugosa]KAA8900960.1 hypothetical protein DIURU_003330 [Diutina rugosa]